MSNPKKRKPTASSGIGFRGRSDPEYPLDYMEGDENHSSAFLGLQDMQQEMYNDIRKSFIGEEEKKFYKRWTKKEKEEMRHEAKLDLEEENRRILEELKVKLEADVGAKYAEELQKMKDLLEREEERSERLEGELRKLREECRKHTAARTSSTLEGF
ncbi:uncharacterized protein LY89DRAFT_673798 [Mollisia scopiformis]|uniref:Uncharacterized protein n=1 Tax=Mollisia scopiformis TaxID=149040 RepID=A0A194WVL2_MOLSC|nr:uncharacterized protein LY89DRAFT_673798 [Mollisia scopiformis]KUJ12005.1 hypothetical protein LY89DRAFT_673798 [Mollisia scopiformis]